MRPEQVLIDEVSVEPQVLLKIGPFSCFCLCDPRGAQGEGSSGHKGVTRKGSSVEIEEVAGADAVGRGRMSRPQSATSLAGSAAGSATGLHPQAPAAAETPEAPVGRVGSTASAASAAPAAPATPGQQPQTAGGLLDPVVSNFQSALVTGSDAAGTKLRKVPFFEGLENFAVVLDQLGGSMGSYLLTNTQKLRKSKASKSEEDYREWLLSELPTHAANGYKGYVDNSAWMANLWIGWTMEFFVEFFALLEASRDTKKSVDTAYNKTLYNHHHFHERMLFKQAVKALPEYDQLLRRLAGKGSPQEAASALSAFVTLGRPVYGYCLKMNEELAKLMEAKRKGGK
mmetsp:Transcript_59914/g.129924  ORF Transcript_59914/g.129924 Transcript_59914/m.129924 type:complete len:342 (-) Transcript_59914:78-1103(-)|eukprot:CAMPEP_0170588544 /NCGR_PEP_ID=MMETSP0224-20130122/10886_1 /TAXON_ID=285029 /ORGANISM="Togula jolla, Strain CCCM 725" /LENGTH=341 /DNA_ID=CAMNT_0010912267 /DNA_START=24 /DNA_END=1049 /DNA_ORIENTATION=+